MKKNIIFITLITITTLLCACGSKNNESSPLNNIQDSASSVSTEKNDSDNNIEVEHNEITFNFSKHNEAYFSLYVSMTQDSTEDEHLDIAEDLGETDINGNVKWKIPTTGKYVLYTYDETTDTSVSFDIVITEEDFGTMIEFLLD